MIDMTTVSKRLTWCAAHRIMNHKGKCAHLHGHNYAADIHVRPDDILRQGNRLDACGFVVDFAIIKARVGGWIDANWDHATILSTLDTETIDRLTYRPDGGELQRLFTLVDENPTAEVLARYLLYIVCPKAFLDSGVECYRVVLSETDGSVADVWFDNDPIEMNRMTS